MHTSLFGFTPLFHIGATYFRKINWLPVFERVESCIVTTDFKYQIEIVPSYINDMFQSSLNRYSTRSKMALDIPLRKTNTGGQQALSFLGPKIWTEISHSTKNAKIYGFFHTYSEEGNFEQTFSVNNVVRVQIPIKPLKQFSLFI